MTPSNHARESWRALTPSLVFHGSDVDLLIDGPATYAEMRSAISDAERYVYMQTYVFDDSVPAREIAQCLAAAAARGVAVYLQCDAFGSFDTSEAMFEELRGAGVHVQLFNELSRLESTTRRSRNSRNHRKILVVDGRVSFTGGINVSGLYAVPSDASGEADEGRGWRDTHLRITGPASLELARCFEESWDSAHPPRLTAVTAPAQRGQQDVAVCVATGDSRSWSEIRKAYLRAIRTASTSVWITQAYFAPDRKFVGHLVKAARRGVDVRILVPGFTDIDIVVAASRHRYSRLLRAGARIFEMRDAVVHAKTAVIDGMWATVGSSNLDYRSFLHNYEANVVVVCPEFAAEMQAQFLVDERRAVEIDYSRWKRRPLLMRLRERAASLFDYWI